MNDSCIKSLNSMSDLPTRQANALRHLLEKREILPEEVAALDYQQIVKAEGVGVKSLGIIRSWLNQHGVDFKSLPPATLGRRRCRSVKKIEQSIDYLRAHGFVVMQISE